MSGANKSEQAFRSVGEVASLLGVAAHVLRYWETKFPKYIAPVKRGRGRRYYRPKDILGARAVKKLVNDNGHTIKGALQILAQQKLEVIVDGDFNSSKETPNEVVQEDISHDVGVKKANVLNKEELRELLKQLRSIKSKIDETLNAE